MLHNIYLCFITIDGYATGQACDQGKHLFDYFSYNLISIFYECSFNEKDEKHATVT